MLVLVVSVMLIVLALGCENDRLVTLVANTAERPPAEMARSMLSDVSVNVFERVMTYREVASGSVSHPAEKLSWLVVFPLIGFVCPIPGPPTIWTT